MLTTGSGALSRRSLLRGAGSLAAAVPLAALLPTDVARAGVTLTRATFVPATGQVFALRGRLSSTRLRLIAVEDLNPASAGHPQRFSLTLRTVSGRQPPQGTWVFQHPRIGTFSMFVARVGRGGDLQAVFNAR